jgi:hypothetical protein
MEMQFGHNTNVTVGDITYHVQTEDRGPGHALIDTTVHCRGRVMHRRTNNYFDLIPLDADREQALKLRLAEQHRTVIDEMRSGTLHLPPLPPEPPARNRNAAAEDEARQVQAAQQAAAPEAAVPALAAAPRSPQTPQPEHLKLALLNAKTWLTGKHAALQILVQDAAGNPLGGAQVVARVEGAASPAEFTAHTGSHGQTQLEFDMPKLAGGDVALVIEAVYGAVRGHLRFALRAKPKVPAAS